VEAAEESVRDFVAAEASKLLAHERFRDGVSGALFADAGSQQRAELFVIPRLQQIAAT
jgi:hypothetical protein